MVVTNISHDLIEMGKNYKFLWLRSDWVVSIGINFAAAHAHDQFGGNTFWGVTTEESLEMSHIRFWTSCQKISFSNLFKVGILLIQVFDVCMYITLHNIYMYIIGGETRQSWKTRSADQSLYSEEVVGFLGYAIRCIWELGFFKASLYLYLFTVFRLWVNGGYIPEDGGYHWQG